MLYNRLQSLFILFSYNFMLTDFPPAPQSLATTIPLFDSLNLPVLNISYRWNHTVLVFL